MVSPFCCDQLRQVFVRQTRLDDVAVGVGGERRAIEDRVDQAALDVLFAPGVGNDVVVIEVAMLRHIARHPVPRPLEHQEIEDAVVNRRAALGLLAQVEVAETLANSAIERRFRRVIIEPRLHVEEVASAGGFDRA